MARRWEFASDPTAKTNTDLDLKGDLAGHGLKVTSDPDPTAKTNTDLIPLE